jgi:hypothetical protein
MKIYYNDGNSSQWVDASSAPQGIQGFTGSKGDLGFTGSQGVGFTGSQGTTGFTGSLGFTGSQGIIGFTGSQGEVTLTGTQTLSNKTFTSNLLSGNIREKTTIVGSAATGTIAYDALTQQMLYYTTNATGNFTINVRGNSVTTLNSIMTTGESITVAFMNTNGTTGFYASAFQIDGTSVTPRLQGGTAPSTGNANSIDVYSYTIVKTGNATFVVVAAQTRFT